MQDVSHYLQSTIIPFWEQLIDREHGGFYGYMDNDGHIDKFANKSLILHSRYLYAFSAWYRAFHDESLKAYMTHSYTFLMNQFYDTVHGGFIWMVDAKGNPVDTTKHIYGQAFAIYGLSEYGMAMQDEHAIDIAVEIYQAIAEHAYLEPPCLYHESFNKKWQKRPNRLLLFHETNYQHTTNTLLHLLEAFQTLYQARKLPRLKKHIEGIIDGFTDILFDSQNNSFYMHVPIEKHIFNGQSYGHDIETCWLLDRALHVIGDDDKKTQHITLKVAESVYQNAFTNKGLKTEAIQGHVIEDRIWWIQAEAMVGFYNHYEKTKDEKYLDAVKSIYQYVQSDLTNPHAQHEWFWGLDKEGKPIEGHGMVEAWKGPYHHGRALLELIQRGFLL